MKFPPFAEWTSITIPSTDATPEQVHVFDEESVLAVRAAMAARRPLLVRGEPGVGKSQLAEAVALKLARPFIPYVVDSRTESRNLMWEFDAVMRLADAQLLGALGQWTCVDEHTNLESTHSAPTSQMRIDAARDWLGTELHIERYIRPGPLWWAFDWTGAQRQAQKSRSEVRQPQPGANANHGCVVLIDEIDKAETDVPNGLLEALGNGRFTPLGWREPVQAKGEPPLVIITSNEERSLPDAFLRRCIVLNLNLPEGSDKDKELIEYLRVRGLAHFPDLDQDPTLLEDAAKQLIRDRSQARIDQTRPLPGQAEYLDLLRAVRGMAKNADERRTLIEKLAPFLFQKNPDGATWRDR